MILTEYAKFLQLHNNELITHSTTALKLLYKWLSEIIYKNPKNNVEKVIHKEVLFAKNNSGDYIIIGKSVSGRKLVTALINFAKSYENYNHAKWLEQTEQTFNKTNN